MLFGSEPAIQVDDLWVRFRTTSEKRPTLSKRLRDLSHRRRSTLVVEALKGVTFDVPQGSVYGVIGRNGAGKSTLLRTIAGILRPTQGEVVLYRRVTPFLSLGIGFNRELTGRENILLGGLASGLTPEQVKEHEQEIIDFADLGDAIDYPMRTYSSGMGGRLGFAVVSHLDPQIVLIDEALAAGDARFKGRCRDKIAAMCEGDCTVPSTVGGATGGIVGALGVAVVAVLALRAMGEWRTITHGQAARREYVMQAEDARGVSLLGRLRGDDRPPTPELPPGDDEHALPPG